MLSTYMSYNLLTKDLLTSLNRVSQQSINAREGAYYRENIGKIGSVDAFLDDYRLYNYAVKAYGLEEMAYAKAFMRKVLESDLTDPNSFVNLLTDTKYRTFAQAFSFKSETAVAQSDAQLDEVIGLYTATVNNAGKSQQEETRYYNIVIDTVTNVDKLFQNERLRDYVFTAFGIDPNTFSYQAVRGALTSDLNDPDSYVNKTFGAAITGYEAKIANANARLADPAVSDAEKAALRGNIATWRKQIAGAERYLALAAAYNFNPDGSLPAGTPAQNAAQKAATGEAYVLATPRVTSAAALLNKAHFEEAVAAATTVEQLLADSRVLNYIKVAYDLNGVTIVPATIRNILTSDPDDPNSYVNTTGKGDPRYVELAKAFNFRTDGTLAAGDVAQDLAETIKAGNLYMTRYNDKDDEADKKLIAQYRSQVAEVTTVDDFFKASSVYKLALDAFGLDPATESKWKIKQVLLSDLNDPKSYVYRLKDSRYLELAKAFNFDDEGSIDVPVMAQTEAEIQIVSKAYVMEKSRFGTPDDKKKAEAEAKYYAEQIQKIDSLKEFLAAPRLVNFVLEANNIDPKTVPEGFLAQIFSSDLDDPDSFVNQQSDRSYRTIVASFNFGATGQVERPHDTAIQTRRGIYQTLDYYVRQAMEIEAGEENAGVRLALYFERNAHTVSSAYDILADDALYEVFKVTFGLPDDIGSADIDAQAELIKRYLDLKDLQDPEKVAKMITKFSVLFDLENFNETSGAVAVLSGGGGSISADTLLSMAQLRTGGR
ncbi:DUF1217 domain-containing protein [Mycoplana dimorpha]|uniref:Uncharacterized protein DUF1217 n=1 Tax=Mycoplana dimorpha TaxID=28320 RepID=A0A2T5BHH5_MYCDI|nr:DUF1217 domain-containing protein [Mycoplana dimorpha]PTM98442.1 uncharacterized protein DUF1217 [Mycoplana dimorpha]